MKLAVAFPGQGAQKVGFTKELLTLKSYQEKFQVASEVLNYDLIALTNSEKIHETQYTQVALFTAGMATFDLLPVELKKQVTTFFGLSLGEYTAVTAAGSFSFEKMLQLVALRGNLMAQIAKKHPGKMYAILNTPSTTIEKACEIGSEFGIVAPCNFNTPKQTVIGGEEKSLAKAVAYLKAEKVKGIIPLKVSGAFHTPLFKSVTTEIFAKLQQLEEQEINQLVLSNATGKIHEVTTMKENLAKQISQPVKMVTMAETLNDLAITHVLELGCGDVVGNLVKKNQKQIQTSKIDDLKSYEAFLRTWEARDVKR